MTFWDLLRLNQSVIKDYQSKQVDSMYFGTYKSHITNIHESFTTSQNQEFISICVSLIGRYRTLDYTVRL